MLRFAVIAFGFISASDSRTLPDFAADRMIKAGWEQKTTKEGEVYYVNHDTKVTRWERPVASAIEDSSSTTPSVSAPSVPKSKSE